MNKEQKSGRKIFDNLLFGTVVRFLDKKNKKLDVYVEVVESYERRCGFYSFISDVCKKQKATFFTNLIVDKEQHVLLRDVGTLYTDVRTSSSHRCFSKFQM